MNDSDNIKTDYEYSRDTYYDLINKGKQSLDLMIEVARESEHPRAFEVLATMIKNVSDVNDRLMDLNKKNKDINQKEPSNKPQAQIENQQNIITTVLETVFLCMENLPLQLPNHLEQDVEIGDPFSII